MVDVVVVVVFVAAVIGSLCQDYVRILSCDVCHRSTRYCFIALCSILHLLASSGCCSVDDSVTAVSYMHTVHDVLTSYNATRSVENEIA